MFRVEGIMEDPADKLLRLHLPQFFCKRTFYETVHLSLQKLPPLSVRHDRVSVHVKGADHTVAPFFSILPDLLHQFLMPSVEAVELSQCHRSSSVPLIRIDPCNILQLSLSFPCSSLGRQFLLIQEHLHDPELPLSVIILIDCNKASFLIIDSACFSVPA